MSARSLRQRPSPEAPARQARWDVRIVLTGLPLQACSVLLRRGRQRVLVDTGFTQHDTLLLEGLAQAGVEPAQITAIINTHYHLDHCGGNLLFPHAPVYGSRRDFDWALSIYESVCGGETRRDVFRQFYPEATDEEFDRMDEARLLQLIRWMWDPAVLGPRERYRWIEDSPWPFPGLRLVPTPGHTPAHFSLAVTGRDGDYMVLGDARAFAGAGPAGPGSDMPAYNHAQYQASLARIERFSGILIPGHDDPFSQNGEEPEIARAASAAWDGRNGSHGRAPAIAGSSSERENEF